MKNDIIKKLNLETIPGSIFVDKRTGKLIVVYKNKRIYTGLKDNEYNRKLAQKIKLNLYLEHQGLIEKNIIERRRSIEETFNEFINNHSKKIEKKTLQSYILSFKRIITIDKYLSEENIEKSIIEFLNNNTELSNTSINIYLRSFQVFLNYCNQNKYLSNVQIYKKYKRKSINKQIEVYNNNEIEILLDYFDKKDYEFKILIILMLSTGMRIGECLKLEKTQIKDNYIILGNKINKNQEVVYINNELKNELMKLNKDNKVFRWKYSSYSRLSRRLKEAFEKLGINNNKSFHEFRKTFLRKLYDENTPLQIAQKLMRHSNINVTIEHYSKIYENELKEYQEKVYKNLQQKYNKNDNKK